MKYIDYSFNTVCLLPISIDEKGVFYQTYA